MMAERYKNDTEKLKFCTQDGGLIVLTTLFHHHFHMLAKPFKYWKDRDSVTNRVKDIERQLLKPDE